jgi:DNA invertase Pin-like site-specific DNA recombinase
VDTTYPTGKTFFQIAGVFAKLERGMIHAMTKAGIEKAKMDGINFGRTPGSKNKMTNYKTERIKMFLQAGKSYDWITKELSVSKKAIFVIKKSLSLPSLQLTSDLFFFNYSTALDLQLS